MVVFFYGIRKDTINCDSFFYRLSTVHCIRKYPWTINSETVKISKIKRWSAWEEQGRTRTSKTFSCKLNNNRIKPKHVRFQSETMAKSKFTANMVVLSVFCIHHAPEPTMCVKCNEQLIHFFFLFHRIHNRV